MTVKQKEKELLNMPDRELVDRILAFPDREHLNRDEEGKRRRYPSAEMAVRAKRNMEQDPEYQISNKQKWAMAHSFAEYSTNELKIVGIKFAKADPNELEKTIISEEGVKTIYDMQFTLMPEPENKHDKNAVAVYVRNLDDYGDGHITFKDTTYYGLTKIGYMPAAYTGIHPITEPTTIKGTLTDHSNGHFKTVSYAIRMDTEEIDASLSKNAAPDKYTYRMPFILNGEVKDGAADYLNNQTWGSNGWESRVNRELECWGINGNVDSVHFDFPSSKSGRITIESESPLSEEAMRMTGGFFRYSLESGISSDLKREGLVDVPLNIPAVDMREKMYLSLQAEPEENFADAVAAIPENNQGKAL